MDIIYGLGGVLLGAAFAYFTTGESGLAWGIVGVFVVLAFVVSAHLTGIRKGEKRVNDL
jgi:hypothetical protein